MKTSSPLPVKEVPLYSEEMCGLEALERLKETLYAQKTQLRSTTRKTQLGWYRTKISTVWNSTCQVSRKTKSS
jgi:hypothetical protein